MFDKYGKETNRSLIIPFLSAVKLSCFSHINDSSDIQMSFQLNSANTTIGVLCPAGIEGCLTVSKREWKVCRNVSRPHNCILVIYGFEHSDDGNYTCSTAIERKDVQSNVINLQTVTDLAPAKQQHRDSEIFIVVGIVIVVLLIAIVVGFIIIKSVQRHCGKCSVITYA